MITRIKIPDGLSSSLRDSGKHSLFIKGLISVMNDVEARSESLGAINEPI